jgi:preprotein translocase subunit YajC
MDANEVIVNIMRGTFDGDLDIIRDAVENRRKTAAQKFVYSLKPGDRVSIHGIRPKALDGATGTVEEVKRTRVGVRIDEKFAIGAGRFAYSITSGRPLTVPAACLRPL